MRYWTSDHHIGHFNILGFVPRPFRSLDEMHAAIGNRWVEAVRQDDEVWVVGDAAMGRREETLKFFRYLPGRKILIPGNHDTCWRGGKKTWESWVPLYRENGFEIMDHGPGEVIETQIEGIPVSVCHFPPHGDRPRGGHYAAWCPDDHGEIFIHGHTHSNERMVDRMVHVGVDAWAYRPVSDLEIAELIRSSGKSVDLTASA